jgi:hypothetical protein
VYCDATYQNVAHNSPEQPNKQTTNKPMKSLDDYAASTGADQNVMPPCCHYAYFLLCHPSLYVCQAVEETKIDRFEKDMLGSTRSLAGARGLRVHERIRSCWRDPNIMAEKPVQRVSMTFKSKQRAKLQEARQEDRGVSVAEEGDGGLRQRPHTAPNMRRSGAGMHAENAAKQRQEELVKVTTQRQRNAMFINREMGKIGAMRHTGL